jgi:uncharacterized protein DUF4154
LAFLDATTAGARRSLAILGVLALAAGGPVHADRLVTSEYAVKAAFLYNFAKFVEWPAGTFRQSPGAVTFCVVGQDPFAGELERVIAGKTVAGRPVAIRYLAQLGGVESCQILFVSSAERLRFEQILAVARRGVLTVGENEAFARAGGIINFTVSDSRVRFQIDQGAAERAGLTISSRLLELAVRGSRSR